MLYDNTSISVFLPVCIVRLLYIYYLTLTSSIIAFVKYSIFTVHAFVIITWVHSVAPVHKIALKMAQAKLL